MSSPTTKTKETSAITPRQKFEGHFGQIWGVIHLLDGQRIITCSEYGSLRVWNLESGKQIGEDWRDGYSVAASIALSPDGKNVVSGSNDGGVRLWDIETGKVIAKWTGHTRPVFSICWSRDGQRVVSGSQDGTVRQWDVKSGETILELGPIKTGHRAVNAAIYSPDTTMIATGGRDKPWNTEDNHESSIKIWDAKTGELVATLKGHTYVVRCLAWTGNGKTLISGSFDFSIRTWNTKTWKQIAVLDAHTSTVNGIAISPNGRILASASWDETAQLWNLDNGQPISSPFQHPDEVNCVSFSADGKLLTTGCDDKNAYSWDVATIVNDAGLDELLLDSKANKLALPENATRHPTQRRQPAHRVSQGFFDVPPDHSRVAIALEPSSHVGYQLKHTALHGTQRYSETIEPFQTMLARLDSAHDLQTQKLRGKYVSHSKAEGLIRRSIDVQPYTAPLRLLHTTTGLLCDRVAQISAFKTSSEYNELLLSIMTHTDLPMGRIADAVATYFRYVMLSHRWGENEPLLHDIQDKIVYNLKTADGLVKLQSFCKTARHAGYHWAWVDSCCIDQNNNVELQKSLNSMFAWYRHSSLTVVYLSDVPPSSKSGALAKSAWNTRGWTVPEFLAPTVIRFYQQDWTPYLDDHSPNHKESVEIMHELEDATGIDACALVSFQPGMRDSREKLQWASTRVTTVPEDIVYSLFGIFDIQLPILYGENKQNALGRLLQEIIARSGDITALDWVGQPSEFNSCLPADISSYEAPPCVLPSLSEGELETAVSSLRQTVAVDLALRLYDKLDTMSAPRCSHCRLHLPCMTFRVTEVRRRSGPPHETFFVYAVKADGLDDLLITTEVKLMQFWRERPTRQTFLLVRPWDRRLLELPDFADDAESLGDWPQSELPLGDSDESAGDLPGEEELVDSESHSQALQLIARLGQPFGAFLLAQQRGGEYKRIASDHDIIAQVKAVTSVHSMMDIRTLEIL